MNRRLMMPLLGAACALAPMTPALAGSGMPQVLRGGPRPEAAHGTGNLLLSLGHGQLVTLPSAMKDIFVADDKVADVQVKSNHQLYVFAKSPGETTIYASNAAGQVIWSTNVRVGSNVDSVDQMLRLAMPEAHIAVTMLGANAVLLTGTVHQPEDIAQAQELVTAYLGKDTNVISRLKTATPLQVTLKVRIAEVNRSLTRAIGANLTTYSSGTSGVLFGMSRGTNQGSVTNANTSTTSTGSTFTLPSNLTNSTALSLAGKAFGLDILGSLDLGEQVGLVTTLAEPNLTALSGETADFLVGGQYPILYSGSLGTTSVEYKNYGVSLSYTPTVLADGRISLRVRPEVSQLDTSNSVTLNGYSVPGLSIRRAETTVELGSGQSFMIAGLLNNTASHTIEKTPGAGDIPVLGALFKSTSFVKGETELVIVITPYLVKPVNDSDIKLPTDGMQNPNDMQRVAAHMLSDGKTGEARPGPTLAPADGSPPATQAAPPQKAPATPPAPAAKAGTSADSAPGFSLN